MVPQNSLLANQGILHRPRLHALIHEGLQHPLLVLLAGPGYGKTQAMVDYLKERNTHALWLRLGALDNLSGHFWNHLTRALEREYPNAAVRLREFEFPDTLSSFDSFSNLLAGEMGGRERVIWVLDDYGSITDPRVKNFVRMLVEANIDNFRLVLISNVLDSTESVAFMTSKRFLLLADDLRFTRAEIAGLYQLHGITLEPDELGAVEQYTEGWPLPLHLLMLQHDRMPDLLQADERVAPDVVSHMFEERFFSPYSKHQQKLLVKLALLDWFTKEFAIGIYEQNAVELEVLGNHVFLITEPASDHLYFHFLYRQFLQKKGYLLTPGEEREVWRQAADYCIRTGEILEAIACYRKCGDYVGMLNAIHRFLQSQKEVTETTARYLMEHIELLAPEQVRQYPLADYLRAWIYMGTVRLEDAETLLLDLERRLLPGGSPDTRALLGDVYATLGAVHMMQNREDFGDYYKRAADYVAPVKDTARSTKMLSQNIHNFSMADNQPGAKERMERAVHYGVPWMAKVLAGGMSGMEHLFSAEAAYLSFQMDEAEQHAYRAVYKADAHAQHDLVCNAYAVLARIGLMRGDYGETTKQIETIVDCAGRHDIGVLREIRDTALGWYYIKMRDHAKIPKSILEITKTEQPILAHGRPQIIYANYLINTGEFAKLVGMLENPKGLYLSRGIWPDRICLYIMLAIGYRRLGNTDDAMKALWAAYDMCFHNGLTTLFIEAGDHMCDLVNAAREQDQYAFSGEYLDFIYWQAGDYARRADAVRSAYRKQNPEQNPKDNPLSKRERDVLQAISNGLTREEIAIEYYISVNTVKSVIRSIYNKLDANNKADAVSIAIARGYIDGYRQP